ncbi:hypothetical protein [Cohnella sp. 56]|uniref:hypothetical protein n=1 Tax=Cohnella sp. 56 TaxID=3113722 RepID=UPI0030E79C7D
MEQTLSEHAGEIAAIFADAAAGAARYTGTLGESIRSLIVRADPSAQGRASNYIAFLLPTWMGERTEAPAELRRDLAAGNVYAMLHFFLLDDLMDGSDAGLGRRQALAAGQLLHALFLERYGRHYPPDSPLWEHYRVYLAEWGAAVAEEGIRRADPREARALARKSAPVKLCAAGLLLSSGAPARIAGMEEAVDLALASLQLADDWADWREDLPDERCNAFLTLVRQDCLKLPEDAPLEERQVLQAIYHKEALDRLASIVSGYGERLAVLPEAAPGLVRFQRSILLGIEQDRQAAKETTDKLASGGGFSYFLSKMQDL